MPCEINDEQLAAFVAGDLPGQQTDGLRTHLEQCPNCRDLVASLRQVDVSLMRIVNLPIPPAVSDRVRQKLYHETGDKEILTLDEVAALLRISPHDLAEIADHLPAFELAGQIRVRRSKLIDWIEQRERLYIRHATQSRTMRILKPDFAPLPTAM